MQELVIYDIDGVLIDSTHRYKTKICNDGIERIDLDHWIENDHHDMIMRDSLLPLVHQYQKDLLDRSKIVCLATARACEHGDSNYKFINAILGKPHHFVHRLGRGDARGGAELKIAGIKPILKSYLINKITVYEDNKSYLNKLCSEFGAIGVYVPSNQGH